MSREDKLEATRRVFIQAYAAWTAAALSDRIGFKEREILWESYVLARQAWERACDVANKTESFDDGMLLTPLRGETAH